MPRCCWSQCAEKLSSRVLRRSHSRVPHARGLGLASLACSLQESSPTRSHPPNFTVASRRRILVSGHTSSCLARLLSLPR
ncbi:hypothetical protein OH76DRAFT_280985 [Lentinus brumalis]|uniref:Uncharacterized protein n=1 Tax=Lentinus brumalis TaxID=2498619 RepID=A0A371CKS9_9APHY|nr:hypothetical protein OH76DRAFT_280985 [Polyporus brumalis]